MARLTAKTLVKRILLGTLWGIASVFGGTFGLGGLVDLLEGLGAPVGFIDVIVRALIWTIFVPFAAGYALLRRVIPGGAYDVEGWFNGLLFSMGVGAMFGLLLPPLFRSLRRAVGRKGPMTPTTSGR